MPELPEVERACRNLETAAKGRAIVACHTIEDTIVFCDGSTNETFAAALTGKTVVSAERHGKYFYMVLSSPPHPVLHLGMAGAVATRGADALYYRRSPKKVDGEEVWPPKYAKFWLDLADAEEYEQAMKEGRQPEIKAQWAFMDSRRFGRARIVDVDDPMTVEPLSLLGSDPLKSSLPLETFTTLISPRAAPIKAVLLAQDGPFAGLGNWMVDEILFQARVHPAIPCSALTPSEVEEVWKRVYEITHKGVELQADYRKFPEDWLFRHRWGKGKDQKGKPGFILPDGTTAVIKYITVGSRTTAVIESLQKPRKGPKRNKSSPTKSTASVGDGEEGEEEEEEARSPSPKKAKRKTPIKVEVEVVEGSPSKRPRRAASLKVKQEVEVEDDEVPETSTRRSSSKSTPRKKVKVEKVEKTTASVVVVTPTHGRATRAGLRGGGADPGC